MAWNQATSHKAWLQNWLVYRGCFRSILTISRKHQKSVEPSFLALLLKISFLSRSNILSASSQIISVEPSGQKLTKLCSDSDPYCVLAAKRMCLWKIRGSFEPCKSNYSTYHRFCPFQKSRKAAKKLGKGRRKSEQPMKGTGSKRFYGRKSHRQIYPQICSLLNWQKNFLQSQTIYRGPTQFETLKSNISRTICPIKGSATGCASRNLCGTESIRK